MTDRPDVADVMAGLKDFQRATVDHVVGRFFDDTDPSSRFLVADEVGLGKTHVARGVIAHLVDQRLAESSDRVDVIYVCANANIAAQNIRKLNVMRDHAFTQATRITLLPLERPRLAQHRVNFLSLTPRTSLDPRSFEGMARERALLLRLLERTWGREAFHHRVPKHLMRVDAGYDSFTRRLEQVREAELDEELAIRFDQEIRDRERQLADAGEATLQEWFEGLCARWRQQRGLSPQQRFERRQLISELRGLLASACIDALQPDLVVLDEFQRFKSLLDPTSEAGELAAHLFAARHTRVLLLSATPYRMYTPSHEEQAATHYDDFVATYQFLADDDAAAARELADELEAHREALLQVGSRGPEPLRDAKQALERRLRRVMARTERLAATANREDMLCEVANRELRLEAGDLPSFVALDPIARTAGADGTLEYWKSAPYLLSFMDRYQFAQRIRQQVDGDGQASAALDASGALLPLERVRQWAPVDPRNPRLRALAAMTVGDSAWKRLWIAPSLPHYQLEAPFDGPEAAAFTKRLVFSSWHVVPKTVAALLSYEAERQMMAAGSDDPPANTPAARNNIARLLTFDVSDGRPTGMPTLALLYPSTALAELTDPLELGGPDATLDDVRAHAQTTIEQALAPHRAQAHPRPVADERWYWAAPILLDRDLHPEAFADWWQRKWLAWLWSAPEERARPPTYWNDHVERAWALIDGNVALGAPPDDLVEVLADLGLAGPAVCGLRAVTRGQEDDTRFTAEVRDAAAHIAWGFRSFLNLPEVTRLIRGTMPGHRYWRAVLRYGARGGLQAVLDEYAHIAAEWLGVSDQAATSRAAKVAETMHEAVSVRTTRYHVHRVGHQVAPGESDTHMRGRFALRFGDDQSDEDQRLNRESQVRTAFNSPFWPFVLITTSMGQEGLDFHLYCHGVVHWNLPANPIDLEQREGRVHRYKGHAVRRNVATHLGADVHRRGDVWAALFKAAVKHRDPTENELVPHWLYPLDDGAAIERLVLALPFSREHARLDRLKRALGAYRLVVGQARQQDLLAFLDTHLDPQQLADLADDLRIDLTPQ